MERGGRILSLDRLRAVCIFLVIVLHVTAAWWFDVPLRSGTFAVLTIYTAAVRICIPCFVMITGALLLGKPSSGDVRYVLFAAMISIAGIRTLSTVLMVNVLGWGLHGVWLGVLADQLSRFIMVSLRFKQGKWVNLKI